MNKEDIVNGNKLIAEFMQLPVSELHGDLCYADWDGMHGVKYHTSFDWLMPVVEKIESLDVVGAVVISRDHCWIHNDKEPLTYENEIIHADLMRKNKIDAVWQCVVQFIQWYNKQGA